MELKCNSTSTPDQQVLKHVLINLESLSAQGKNYKWKRPRCLTGCKKVWGHGYVLRFFTHLRDGVYLKRWRCPDCGIVILMLPTGYWKGYQSSIETIFSSLKTRIQKYRWPSNISRQRGGHWLIKFIAFLRITYGDNNSDDLLEKLKLCHTKKLLFLGQ